MNDIFSKILKPKKNLFGCDVGATSVKFVLLKKNKGLLSLESLGIIEADILGENHVALQRTRAYLKEYDLLGHQVALNIEDKSLRIRRMDLPEMPKNDLKIAIRWNFREYVDGAVEKYAVDYSLLNGIKIEGDKKPFLAFAVSSESIDLLTKAVKTAGLKPSSVEPNATALLSAFDLSTAWEKDKFYVIIDLGGMTANFIVVGNECLLFSRLLANANCDVLVKNLTKDLGITPEQALAHLKSYQSAAKLSEEINTKLQASIEQFFGLMVVEIQRSIDAFCLMFHVEKVETIFLCGGGSLLPGISGYLTKNLGIATKLFNPFEKIVTSEVGGNIPNSQLFAVAVGLAVPKA